VCWVTATVGQAIVSLTTRGDHNKVVELPSIAPLIIRDDNRSTAIGP